MSENLDSNSIESREIREQVEKFVSSPQVFSIGVKNNKVFELPFKEFDDFMGYQDTAVGYLVKMSERGRAYPKAMHKSWEGAIINSKSEVAEQTSEIDNGQLVQVWASKGKDFHLEILTSEGETEFLTLPSGEVEGALINSFGVADAVIASQMKTQARLIRKVEGCSAVAGMHKGVMDLGRMGKSVKRAICTVDPDFTHHSDPGDVLEDYDTFQRRCIVELSDGVPEIHDRIFLALRNKLQDMIAGTWRPSPIFLILGKVSSGKSFLSTVMADTLGRYAPSGFEKFLKGGPGTENYKLVESPVWTANDMTTSERDSDEYMTHLKGIFADEMVPVKGLYSNNYEMLLHRTVVMTWNPAGFKGEAIPSWDEDKGFLDKVIAFESGQMVEASANTRPENKAAMEADRAFFIDWLLNVFEPCEGVEDKGNRCGVSTKFFSRFKDIVGALTRGLEDIEDLKKVIGGSGCTIFSVKWLHAKHSTDSFFKDSVSTTKTLQALKSSCPSELTFHDRNKNNKSKQAGVWALMSGLEEFPDAKLPSEASLLEGAYHLVDGAFELIEDSLFGVTDS